jgi:transposase
MAREAPIIHLSVEESQQLHQLVNARSTPQGLAFRARIILRCDQKGQRGVPRNEDVAAELGCDPNTVSRWRRRFRDQRLEGLLDRPRSGRPRAFSP